MRVTRRILLASLGTGVYGAADRANAAQEVRFERSVFLGETRVRVVVEEIAMKAKRAFIYFHPHENEHSSDVVTRHIIRRFGGKLVEIRSQGERLISFRLNGNAYSFDPNRMFTEVGLESSLAHFAPISQAPLDCARKLRDAVLAQLGKGKTPIIATHNNVQDGMSIYSFQPGGMYASQAAKIALNGKETPRNFFLVLDEGLFARLHHAGFNVVLQSTDPSDDGSLSVYCRREHWPYVNVEAAEGDMNEQMRMMEALHTLIT